MKQDGARLRRELAEFESGRGKRYPAGLRGRVVAWARQRRSAGASWEEVKRELGQRGDTIRRWCRMVDAPLPRTRALVPVRIVPQYNSTRLVTVVSARGHRVEGLTIAEAAQLLGELG